MVGTISVTISEPSLLKATTSSASGSNAGTAGRPRGSVLKVSANRAQFCSAPISGRLRGIYLGLASLGLVFLGQHILENATLVTGGYNGRDTVPFELFGFKFSNTSPDSLIILGPLRGPQRTCTPPDFS